MILSLRDDSLPLFCRVVHTMCQLECEVLITCRGHNVKEVETDNYNWRVSEENDEDREITLNQAL